MPIQALSSMDSINLTKARSTKSMTVDSTASKLYTKTPISTNQIHRKKNSRRKHQSCARLWRKNISNNGSTKIAPKIQITRTRSGKILKIFVPMKMHRYILLSLVHSKSHNFPEITEFKTSSIEGSFDHYV